MTAASDPERKAARVRPIAFHGLGQTYAMLMLLAGAQISVQGDELHDAGLGSKLSDVT